MRLNDPKIGDSVTVKGQGAKIVRIGKRDMLVMFYGDKEPTVVNKRDVKMELPIVKKIKNFLREF